LKLFGNGKDGKTEKGGGIGKRGGEANNAAQYAAISLIRGGGKDRIARNSYCEENCRRKVTYKDPDNTERQKREKRKRILQYCKEKTDLGSESRLRWKKTISKSLIAYIQNGRELTTQGG